MGDLALTFDDGTVAWLHLAPVADGARPVPPGAEGGPKPGGAGGDGAPGGPDGAGGGADGGESHGGGPADAHGAPGGASGLARPDLELPAGFGAARPVSADSRAARALTTGGQALVNALRPLGGVLESIHQSLADSARRPDEVTVEFGVTLGTDLSLGVFTGTGEANFTVSATWNLGSTTA
ncbi:CU044_2847 family protein [Streptomyces sp. NPDC057702]|uniref:CU044_2847 family protein n=1 Tax=unclassified Streptomyces TaxID=2593676 RepID=UPI0036A35795